MPECSFSQGHFQCKLPENTVDVEVKIRTMRGIHTFQRDCTTKVISCKPWDPQLCPCPSLTRKMKIYLELKGQSIDRPSFNPVRLPMSFPLKTPVQKRSREEEKQDPYRRPYKVTQPQKKRKRTSATSTATNPLANYKTPEHGNPKLYQ